MSLTAERTVTTWEARPGWGISVDLTPGEILSARSTRVHKRLILLALVLVLLACAGAALLALDAKSAAEDSYTDGQLDTTQLTADTADYADLTTMQRVIDQTDAQVATLMANDVDFVNLMAKIRVAMPPNLSLVSASVVLSPTSEIATGDESAAAAPSPRIIGSISLSGGATLIRDVNPFVSALNSVEGVVDVVPQSVTKSDEGVTFTMTASITNELLTQRFGPVAADPAGPAATGGATP